MLLDKLLTTTVELLNPDEIYAKNIDEIVMNILKDRYEGQCFGGSYIKSIDKIVRKSSRRMSTIKLDGSCSMDVIFKATVIYFFKNELIFGVKITKNKTRDGSIIGLTDCASIIIKHDKILSYFGDKYIIPCIIDDAKYGIFKSVSVVANAFKPKEKEIMFYIVNEKNEKINISDSLENVSKQILDKFNNIKNNKQLTNTIDIFSDLLYVFKEQKKFSLNSHEFKIMKLTKDEFERVNQGIYIRPSELRQEKLQCYYYPFDNNIFNTIKLKYKFCFVTLSKLYEFLYCDYLIFISSLCDMIEYFSTKEKTDKTYTEALIVYKDNKLV